MQMIVAGASNKTIAIELGVSQRTVEHHRRSMMRKTGAKSLAALVRMVIESQYRDETRGDH
jgi:two-component system CheB/CheR fusion protein